MSILSVENDKYGNEVYTLYEKLIYIMRATAARDEYIYGAGISVYYSYGEMMKVKKCYHQMDGKAYFHYVLNPEKSDMVCVDEFYEIGKMVAEIIAHFYGRYQVVMALHFDDDSNVHMHLIANNIDIDTGARMNLDRNKLNELKQRINQIMLSYDISAIRQKFLYENNGN